MGFFNKVNSALGIGKNNDALRIGAGLMTGGLSEVATGGAQDLLMGKKAKDIKPDAIANQIRATQTKGLGELNAALDKSSGENTVRLQAAQAEKGVLSSAQDARRNAQKLMAQRGLSGSSMGLSSQRSIDQTQGQEMASIRANLPGQIRNQQLQDAQTRIQAGGINQNGMNFNTIQGQRSGGIMGIAGSLAPVAGMIAGGMMGGPAGAAAGGQVGQGLGQVFASPDAAGGKTGYSQSYLNTNNGRY